MNHTTMTTNAEILLSDLCQPSLKSLVVTMRTLSLYAVIPTDKQYLNTYLIDIKMNVTQRGNAQ